METLLKQVHRQKSLYCSCQGPERIKQWTVQFWMWVEWVQIILQMDLRGQVWLSISSDSWLPRFMWVNEAWYCCRRLLKRKDGSERRRPWFPVWPATCTGTWDIGVWWRLNNPFLTSRLVGSRTKDRTPSKITAAKHGSGTPALAFILSPVH